MRARVDRRQLVFADVAEPTRLAFRFERRDRFRARPIANRARPRSRADAARGAQARAPRTRARAVRDSCAARASRRRGIRAVGEPVFREHRQDVLASARPKLASTPSGIARIFSRAMPKRSPISARDEIESVSHEIRARERFRKVPIEKSHALDRMRLGEAQPREIVHGRERRPVERHQHVVRRAESSP